MEFDGGFREDTDKIAGYDQAHASAQEALASARGFFLVVLKEEHGEEIEAHVGANASIEEVEDMAITASSVAYNITEICREHRDEDFEDLLEE